MRLLFFHNTLAEYRIGFFNELNKICELRVVFTDYDIGESVYKNKIDKTKLEFKYDIISGSRKDRIHKCIEIVGEIKPDWIIIPALDDLYSVNLGRKLVKYSHSIDIKVGFFWEKWCWEYSDMPISRIIKEIAQRFLVSPIIKNTDALMAPGRKTAEYLKSCGSASPKIFKIHDTSEIDGIENIDIKEKYNISDDSRIILYLGRIVKYKGLDKLILAYSNLPDSFKDRNYLIIGGDGPEREACELLVAKFGLRNVIFCGQISPKDRYSYYKYSDVFVLPSMSDRGHIEAWGLSLNEAIQFGNILIATNAVGAAYELINEKNGFMIEENSVSELSEALLKADSKKLKVSAEEEDSLLFESYNYRNMAKDVICALEGNGSCICF